MLIILLVIGALLQVVHDKDTQTLIDLLNYALGPGSAIIVYGVVRFVLGQLTDTGHPLSPFAARWLTWLITFIVPTALYGLLILISKDPWSWSTWILDVLAAFGISQMIHGQVDLPREPVKSVPLTETEKREGVKPPATEEPRL